MIAPGFRVIVLPVMVIVPPETLLMAAPLPPPEPLPVKVELMISTRPSGSRSRFGGSVAHS